MARGIPVLDEEHPCKAVWHHCLLPSQQPGLSLPQSQPKCHLSRGDKSISQQTPLQEENRKRPLDFSCLLEATRCFASPSPCQYI